MRILVWGEAGMGKTTFCEKLCQDWALAVTRKSNREQDELSKEQSKLEEEQVKILSKIELLFHIVLRESTESQTLEQTIQSYLKNISLDKISGHVCLLLLFDGLDEVSYSKGELLEVIKGKKYQNIRCIVTCRPHAALAMSWIADAEIQLTGFNSEQAEHFVLVYFLSRYENTDISKLKAKQCWEIIQSSQDLSEMSWNPSMLQLMCLVYLKTGKIGRDRASLFEDYTNYLLNQYQLKYENKHLTRKQLNSRYRETLVKIGHLALKGLKQSHLQLVFTKEEVLQDVGNIIFQFGFVSELPHTDVSAAKVQFTHKSLQEYLAAFAVINSPKEQGLQLLLQFSSRSESLMGSQIILTFIISMSKSMRKVIQKKLHAFVQSCAENDNVSPNDRVNFLITMLRENRSLKFPLPKEININLLEHEKENKIRKWSNILHSSGKKSTIHKFFSLESKTVRSVNIALGRKHRLDLLKMTQLDALKIDFQNSCKSEDFENLTNLIFQNRGIQYFSIVKFVEPISSEIYAEEFLNILSDLDSLICLRMQSTDAKIDETVAGKITQLPGLKELDLSGNRFTGKTACLACLKVAYHLSDLNLQNCGIEIDAEIVRAVSKLPDQMKTNLSNNKILKMNLDSLLQIVPYLRYQENMDLSDFGITINNDLVHELSLLPKNSKVDLSQNKFKDKASCVSLIKNSHQLSSLNLQNCKIHIDREIKEAVLLLPDQLHLDLSENEIQDREAILISSIIKYMEKQENHDFSNCDICIDQTLLRAIDALPRECKVDLSGNRIEEKSVFESLTERDLNILVPWIQLDPEIENIISHTNLKLHLNLSQRNIIMDNMSIPVHWLPYTQKSNVLNFTGLGLALDIQFADCVQHFPQNASVVLSGNRFTDKTSCITLINNAHHLFLLDLRKCDIILDIETAVAVFNLPPRVNFSISDNQKSDKVPDQYLIDKLVHHERFIDFNISRMKITLSILEILTLLPSKVQVTSTNLDIAGLGIKIKEKTVESLMRIKGFTSLCVNDNDLLNKNNWFTEEAAVKFSSFLPLCPQIQNLLLINCAITDESCMSLMRGLSKHCRQLRILELGGNKIPKTGEILGECLQCLDQLFKLDVTSCDISDEACFAIVSLCCKDMIRLYLGGNHISSNGLSNMLPSLTLMERLSRLELYGNPCCKDKEMMQNVVGSLKLNNPHLKEIF